MFAGRSGIASLPIGLLIAACGSSVEPAPAPEAPPFPAEVRWAVTGGGGLASGRTSVAMLGEDPIVFGDYRSAARFGDVSLPLAIGADNMTVAALTGVDRGVRWARAIGGSDRPYCVTTGADAIYVSGRLLGGNLLNVGQPDATPVAVSAGSGVGFVARYSPQGALVWAHPIGDATGCVELGADGTVWVGGAFSGTVQFRTGESSAIAFASESGHDGLITHLGPDGAVISALQIRGTATARATRGAFGGGVGFLSRSADGGVFASGAFHGEAMIREGVVRTTLGGHGDVTSYLLKLDAGGRVVWTRVLADGAFAGRPVELTSGAVVLPLSYRTALSGPGGLILPDTGFVRSAPDHDTRFLITVSADGAPAWWVRLQNHPPVEGDEILPELVAIEPDRFAAIANFDGGTIVAPDDPRGGRSVDIVGTGRSSFAALFSAIDGRLEGLSSIGGAPASLDATGLAIAPDGDWLITGTFTGTVTFGLGGASIRRVNESAGHIFVLRAGVAR